MVLPLSFLLFVFLADDLDQACATTRSFRRSARSDATCTVQQFPIKRPDPKLRCQEWLSVIVEQDLGGMVQNAPHEPRNSICQVLSQDPRKMRGCLDDSPIVCLRISISCQDLKAVSF